MVNYLYEEEISKVIGQRNELVALLSDVLDAWVTTVYVPEDHRLYVKANEYLIGLRDE